ncbi:MAG TPA: ABC transporter permease [Candidatus Methylacidiphilales bacterium]|jgi:lipoprotein-releasing system permease protein|nr:ABC transporter permease [Candidatus Methylacidiphilales bacterium]
MQLPVELFLALRYLRPRRTFVSIITVLSFLGVLIGVGVLIVVLSVMAGFQETITNNIIGFNAHITVAMADDSVMPNYDKVVDFLDKQPDVVAASAFIRGPVLVQHNGAMSPAFIKSAPIDGDDPVLPLKKYLKAGDWELHGDSVIIGEGWGRHNSAFIGDKITIYGAAQVFSFMHRNDKNASIALPEEPIVRGIFETGQAGIDNEFLLVSIETAQKIWGMRDEVHGIAVRIKDPDRAEEVKDRLNDALAKNLSTMLTARTWMDDNRDWFNALAVERTVMAVILCLTLLVAAFGLCSTLITVTVQKSREIGLMKALGANDLQVCGVFLLHGFVVGVFGAAGGTVLGLLLLHNLDNVRDFILNVFHVQVFAGSVYGLPNIPAIINPMEIAVIDFFALLICVLAALIPAVSAARLAPARALRYE